ncbi:MAG: hypothetical protein KBT15_02675 [Bacteroidales bacterium]|nr:hypothetical protein [Candidatus Minthousia equi]
MKKICLLFLGVICMALSASAKNDYQLVATECGTVHGVPANATTEEAVAWLIYWSEWDCGVPADQF